MDKQVKTQPVVIEPQTTKVIEFRQHVHSEHGNNLTVRRGTKYAELEVGEMVELAETGKKPDKLARITAITTAPLYLIPSSWLRLQHDEACRTPEGLKVTLERIYGDIRKDELFTLVFYKLEQDGD